MKTSKRTHKFIDNTGRGDYRGRMNRAGAHTAQRVRCGVRTMASFENRENEPNFSAGDLSTCRCFLRNGENEPNLSTGGLARLAGGSSEIVKTNPISPPMTWRIGLCFTQNVENEPNFPGRRTGRIGFCFPRNGENEPNFSADDLEDWPPFPSKNGENEPNFPASELGVGVASS
jgi:hypothetical protein